MSVCVHMSAHNGVALRNSSAVKKHLNRWTQSHTRAHTHDRARTHSRLLDSSRPILFFHICNINVERGRGKKANESSMFGNKLDVFWICDSVSVV